MAAPIETAEIIVAGVAYSQQLLANDEMDQRVTPDLLSQVTVNRKRLQIKTCNR
jgi:hypothetical protein